MQSKFYVGIGAVALAADLWGVFGCGGNERGVAAGEPVQPQERTVTLVPYRDPWQYARPRLWDVTDHELSDFVKNGYDYSKAQVTLRYDIAPNVPYFVGSLEAKGLKPNFAYQMKLAGKPVKGSRGWGKYGDDLANSRLGAAGRWWCESTHEGKPSFDDDHYRRYYTKAKPGQAHNMYGYIFIGTFVTDENGSASFRFQGSHSYHITWRDEQKAAKDVPAGTYTIESREGYGYGSTVPGNTVKLWYEYQVNRPHQVRLPKGTYHCRLLLTEETFHNLLGGTRDALGGYWQTVLANEDFDNAGKPDSDAANDVVFTIR
jgi:hypothetical protein